VSQRQQSSRGAHRRSRQARMNLEAAFAVPEAKQERIDDGIYTLFDDDFSPSIKSIKDWILESYGALGSYFNRPSKIEEIKNKKLGFKDGMAYFVTILLSELTADQGKSLADEILEDLGPLVAEFCDDCKKKVNDETT